MKYFIFIILLSLCNIGSSQNYSTSLIPDSIKANANAVKRFEELHVVIKGIDKAVVKHRYAITILNENGDYFSHYSNEYNNLISLSEISGRLFDADGKLIRTIKKKDISDRSATDDENLLTDVRVKEFAFYHKVYPYTVEFEDEQIYDGVYYLPEWIPVTDDKFSVQESRFIVETPSNYKLRYRQQNYEGKPQVTLGKTSIYTWQISNRIPINYESYQPDFIEIVPSVFIAPSEFSIGSYKGDMTSWHSFGKFISELNNKRDELPDNIKSDVHRIADATANPIEKAKLLYKYLQQNTRYISIQLGIGSWQPFDAKFVAQRKYGDCKALSNYMVSILKEVGVKANYVLITAGDGRKGLWEDFPSPYFNHVVCCVPNGKDTLWLECTSQTQLAGYMGSFTGDRKALLIGDDGGYIVSTPFYSEKDNLQQRKVKAVVDADGNLEAEVNTLATGMQQELMHSLLYESNKTERQNYLNKVLSLPTYEVERSEYMAIPGEIAVINENLHIKAARYATVSGKRLFITPNLFNRSGNKLSEDANRKYSIRFKSSFRDIDTVQITIPEGYQTEAVPANTTINNSFGKYTIEYLIKDNFIQIIRMQERQKHDYPASEFPQLVKYFDTVYKADHSRIVFVKKELK